MATKIKEFIGYTGGTEGQLSGMARFYLYLGIVILIVCLIVSGEVTKQYPQQEWGENGLSPVWVALGIIGLIQGIVLSKIIHSGAEIIRLLKKLNGLNYGGKISEAREESRLKCSKCGNTVVETDWVCYQCSEKFENSKSQ